MGVEDIAANEFRGRVTERHVIGADWDHEIRVLEPRAHGRPDGELLFHSRLPNVLGEDDDLLDRLLAQNLIDLIPEVIPAAKAISIDPDFVACRCKLRGKPQGCLLYTSPSPRDS